MSQSWVGQAMPPGRDQAGRLSPACRSAVREPMAQDDAKEYALLSRHLLELRRLNLRASHANRRKVELSRRMISEVNVCADLISKLSFSRIDPHAHTRIASGASGALARLEYHGPSRQKFLSLEMQRTNLGRRMSRSELGRHYTSLRFPTCTPTRSSDTPSLGDALRALTARAVASLSQTGTNRRTKKSTKATIQNSAYHKSARALQSPVGKLDLLTTGLAQSIENHEWARRIMEDRCRGKEFAIDRELLKYARHSQDVGNHSIKLGTQERKHPVFDAAILTVTKDEYDAVYPFLENPRPYQPAAGRGPRQYAWVEGWLPWKHGQAKYRVVLAMVRKQGNTSASSATVATYNTFKPRYVVFVGIAGGFPKDGISRGSVVVSSLIWGYEYGKISNGKYLPRMDLTYQVDENLVSSALALNTSNREWQRRIRVTPPESVGSITVVEGPIASGEKIVDDVGHPVFASVLNMNPRLVAVEMEGAGAAHAIQKITEAGNAVGFVMIRGISDMPQDTSRSASGEQHRPSDTSLAERDDWTPFAAAAAAAFAVGFIEHEWPFMPASQAEQAET